VDLKRIGQFRVILWPSQAKQIKNQDNACLDSKRIVTILFDQWNLQFLARWLRYKRPRPAIRGWNKTLCELSADGEIKVVSASGAFITITSLWNKRDQWCGMHAPWRHARINYMLRRLTALTFEVNGTLRRQSARQCMPYSGRRCSSDVRTANRSAGRLLKSTLYHKLKRRRKRMNFIWQNVNIDQYQKNKSRLPEPKCIQVGHPSLCSSAINPQTVDNSAAPIEHSLLLYFVEYLIE